MHLVGRRVGVTYLWSYGPRYGANELKAYNQPYTVVRQLMLIVAHVKCVYLTIHSISHTAVAADLEIMPASVLLILTKHLGKQKVCVKYNHGLLECDTLSSRTWLTTFLKDLQPQSLGW